MRRRELLTGGVALAAAAAAPAASAVRGSAGPALVVDGLDTSELTRDYVLRAKNAGVGCIHKSVGGLLTFAQLYEFIDRNGDVASVCRTVQDIRDANAKGRVAIILGWQGADVLATNRAGVNDWWGEPHRTELRAYYELGLRVVGIAYQIANVFGGGGTDGDIGLTRAGRALVEDIHRLRIVLDVAGHTGDRASFDAIAMSSGIPVVCTHGNTRHFANSTRNLSDEMIDAIAKSGGVIGMNAINDFVMRGREMANVEPTPQGTVKDLVRHANYIRSRVGAQHVGLGPDFTSGAPETTRRAAGVRDYPLFGPEVIDRGLRRFVTGFEDVSQVGNVRDALEQSGWSAEEIRGFMGENWLRVYRQVWGS